MSDTASSEPNSCTLGGDELPDRLAAWRGLAEHALSRKEGRGWVVSTYPMRYRSEVTRLIAAEAECCSFLRFEVRDREDQIDVRIEYPPEFAPMLGQALTPRPSP